MFWDQQWGVCDSARDPSDQLDLEHDRPYTTLLSNERYIVDIYETVEQALVTANSQTSGRRRTTINPAEDEWFFGLVASPDSGPPDLAVSIDVFAGEDDSVQFDEGLRVNSRTGVTPVDCEVSAWLTGNPTGDFASGD